MNTGGVLTNLYINSAYHTAKLGQFVAIGLKEMGIPYEDIHLIGHSLGAQTAGSAGRHFYEITGQKIKRITGLDPARPCFFTPTVFPRIGRGDGEFVDIIHTNPGSLGTEEPLGNIDFYPGGLDVNKPGCDPLTPRCSHGRAIYYYDETVYPGHEMDYMGVKCNDYNELESKTCDGDPSEPMGYATPSSANGIYYLEVRAESPYGMNATSAIANDDCGVCNNN